MLKQRERERDRQRERERQRDSRQDKQQIGRQANSRFVTVNNIRYIIPESGKLVYPKSHTMWGHCYQSEYGVLNLYFSTWFNVCLFINFWLEKVMQDIQNAKFLMLEVPIYNTENWRSVLQFKIWISNSGVMSAALYNYYAKIRNYHSIICKKLL